MKLLPGSYWRGCSGGKRDRPPTCPHDCNDLKWSFPMADADRLTSPFRGGGDVVINSARLAPGHVERIAASPKALLRRGCLSPRNSGLHGQGGDPTGPAPAAPTCPDSRPNSRANRTSAESARGAHLRSQQCNSRLHLPRRRDLLDNHIRLGRGRERQEHVDALPVGEPPGRALQNRKATSQRAS